MLDDFQLWRGKKDMLSQVIYALFSLMRCRVPELYCASYIYIGVLTLQPNTSNTPCEFFSRESAEKNQFTNHFLTFVC